jgi:hypothetical protein
MRSLVLKSVLAPFVLALLKMPATADAAFAYGRDQTGRAWFGSSLNELSESAAAQAAISRCSQKGPGCQLIRTFRLGCFAFSASSSGAAGFGGGTNKARAESNSMSQCVSHSSVSQSCQIQHSFCDFVAGPLAVADSKRREIEARSRQQDQDRRSTSACSLSGKELRFAYRICAGAGQCNAQFGVVRVLGEHVLEYSGAPGSSDIGMDYELGKTKEVSAEDSRLLDEKIQRRTLPGTVEHTYLTASYDGGTLFLYSSSIKLTSRHEYLPDATAISLMTRSHLFKVSSCSSCSVEGRTLEPFTESGPKSLPFPLTGQLTEQSCQLRAIP